MNGRPLWVFGLAGMWFGIVLVKAQVLSWFRIQEMFRFDSFHMYGIIGSAIVVGLVGRLMLGQGPVRERPSARHLVGGTIFGLGWGLTGACPGPMYALIGQGVTPYVIVLLSAIAGTWTYGRLRDSRLAEVPAAATSLNLS